MGRDVARAVGWLALYVGVVGWLTWPLAAHLTTDLPHAHVICNFDQPQMIWALAWTSHRLLEAPAQLFDANIYHPMPHALLYAEAGFGALPFFFPTFVATGDPTLAANVMFLGSLALTAWGLHLLLHRWTGSVGAGAGVSGVRRVAGGSSGTRGDLRHRCAALDGGARPAGTRGARFGSSGGTRGALTGRRVG